MNHIPSSRVNLLADDDSDVSEVVPLPKRAKISQKVEKADDDFKVIEVAGNDDSLPPPPKVIFDKSKESGEDSTIKALRCTMIRIMGLTSTLVIIQKRSLSFWYEDSWIHVRIQEQKGL